MRNAQKNISAHTAERRQVSQVTVYYSYSLLYCCCKVGTAATLFASCSITLRLFTLHQNNFNILEAFLADYYTINSFKKKKPVVPQVWHQLQHSLNEFKWY